jgi:type VI secretion system protein ImpG
VDNEALYRAFIEELQALESFRMSYVAEHPAAPLAPDDPDVRRLVEALAFFAARSRQAAMGVLVDQRRRLFRQFLPYLLDPLPAMAMLQAVPNGRLTEAIVLPRDTQIALRDASDRVALFRTLRPLRLLPLTLGRMHTLVLPDGRLRFTLPMATSHPRNDEIGPLSIHVNYINDFNSSLKVLHALERHVARVAVTFDDAVDEHTRGEPCQLTFPMERDDEDAAHPLARERAYFHFPRTELFFELGLPTPPRNWQRFTLLFDVTPDWPRKLRLTSEVLQLFATPIENLTRASAQPILHDGTQERWPIRHASPAGGYELRSVRGVYRVAGGAQVPLRAATIAGAAGAYELDDEPRAGEAGCAALLLHLPEALSAPTTISIDAEWLQPWFSTAIGQRLSVTPYRHMVPGVEWELNGNLVPHAEPAQGATVEAFTHILVLQHKSRLGRDDLDSLLQILGSVWSGPFASVRPLITDVKVHEAPFTRGARVDGSKLVYELILAQHEPALEPLVETFARHLQRVLDAWVADLPVEVRVGERT